MSFRLKTVLGIAAIEGLLLLVLVWSSSTTLVDSTQEELRKRGETALQLLQTTALDDVLSEDLGTLLEFVNEVVKNEGFLYARIRGADGKEFASAGDPVKLAEVRTEDLSAGDVDDGVYDVVKVLNKAGSRVGSIELGISTVELENIRRESLQRLGLIAVIEMILVAIFSLVLGEYLTRELARLENAAQAVAAGDLGHQVEVSGTDEISRTIRSFNDMSQRVQNSYQELEQSEALYRSSQLRLDGLVASLMEGVCLVDDQLQLLFANPAASDQLSLLGNREVEIGSPIRIPDLSRQELLVDSGRGNFEVEWEVESVTHSFDLTSGMVRNQQTEKNEWVLVIRDVTDERQAQERVQTHARLVAVGQLASGISHDFNNILSVIIGFSELTLLSESLPKKVRDNTNAVLVQSERAAELVRQILDFSRDVDANREQILLNDFLPEALKMFNRALPSSVEIELDLQAERSVIEFNETKLHQVLTNLLLNAVDAMPTGGTITIQTRREFVNVADPESENSPSGDCVSLSIHDTGIGMAPEILERIFEPFFTTKPRGKGTGLGLAQAYGLVNQNGCDIQVESQLSVGTRFTILFPTSAQEVSEKFSRKSTPPLPSSGDAQRTILLVEDQAEVLEAVTGILVTLGYKVLIASDGVQAIDLFKENREKIDAVLSDVVMPRMSGDAMVRQLRELGFEKAIILMSGYFPKEGIDLAELSAMINGFLQKPVRTRDLKEMLIRCLGEDASDPR